jgi:hypothetical protein
VVQRGEFGDAGEDFTEDFGAWMGAGEFKRLFMKHLADCFLDAGLLREVAVAFHVLDGVEDLLGAEDFVHTSPPGAEATKAGEVDFDAETFGRWRGDFVHDRDERHVFLKPFEEPRLLFGLKTVIEGVCALFALDGFTEERATSFGIAVERFGFLRVSDFGGAGCVEGGNRHDIIVFLDFCVLCFHKCRLLIAREL